MIFTEFVYDEMVFVVVVDSVYFDPESGGQDTFGQVVHAFRR